MGEALKVGSPAPNFRGEATGGRQVSLADFKGKKPVVIVFYCKNNTPG